MQRWYDLYYCSRDDIVFDRASDLCAPVEQMIGFLYRYLDSTLLSPPPRKHRR